MYKMIAFKPDVCCVRLYQRYYCRIKLFKSISINKVFVTKAILIRQSVSPRIETKRARNIHVSVLVHGCCVCVCVYG